MLKNLFQSTAIYGLADFAGKFLAFAIFPIYAHLFTIEEFGVLGMVLTLAGLLGIAANLGLNSAVQRYYFARESTKESRKHIVTTGLSVLAGWATCFTLIAATVLWFARETIETRYRIEWLLIALALATTIPSQLLQYCQDVLRIQFAPWKFAVVSILRNVAGAALGLWLVIVLHFRVDGLFLGQLVAAALAVPIALCLIRGEVTFHFHPVIARKLVGYGYPLVFNGFAFWVVSSFDLWLLSQLSDATQVGLYSIAIKFATILTFITSAFGQAWAPIALRAFAEDAGYRERISNLFAGWFFALACIGVALGLFGRELLLLLTPASYWLAADVLTVLAMAAVMFGTTQFTMLGLSIEGKTAIIARSTWITAGVSVSANLLLIPQLGAMGAGLSALLTYSLLTALYLHHSQRFHPLPLPWRKLGYVLLLLSGATAFGVYANTLAWSPLLLAAKFSALVVVLLIGVTCRLVDLRHVSSLIRFRATNKNAPSTRDLRTKL